MFIKKDINNVTKLDYMKILIIGILLFFIGIFLWFFYPLPFTEIFGIRIFIKDFAPIITFIGAIGIGVGYFIKL